MRKRIISIVLPIMIILNGLSIRSMAGSMNQDEINFVTSDAMDIVVLVNHLTVVTTDINARNNNRLYLDEVSDMILSNYRLEYIDENTQYYINNLIGTINKYKMIDIKRQRLDFIYEQNKAQAIRDALPSPLSVMNIVQSGDITKLVTSFIFMTVNSVVSYENTSEAADLEYLKDGWELDDQEMEAIQNSKLQLFNYIIDIAREKQLPDEYLLRSNNVDDFVKYKENNNVAERIRSLKRAENTFKMFGGYWLLLARSYYEDGQYENCINAVKEYEKLNVSIFRKDKEFASVIPMVLSALEKTASREEYLEEGERYVNLLIENTDRTDWELRYVAAQMLLVIASTKEGEERQEYMREAYDYVLDNIQELIVKQRAYNELFINDVVENEVPKDASSKEKSEIKQYNKMLNDKRKTELPTVYQPLLLNCSLLYSLKEELALSTEDEQEIQKILYPNNDNLFLNVIVDNLLRTEETKREYSSDVFFDGKQIKIPVPLLSQNTTIDVKVGTQTTRITDWKVEKVDRGSKNSSFDDFIATFTSTAIKKVTFAGSSPKSGVKSKILL